MPIFYILKHTNIIARTYYTQKEIRFNAYDNRHKSKKIPKKPLKMQKKTNKKKFRFKKYDDEHVRQAHATLHDSSKCNTVCLPQTSASI